MSSTTQTISQQFLSNLPRGTPPELATAIEDAVNDAFGRHGPPAFMQTREAAIAHECGHGIVGWHEGLIIESLRIFSRPSPLGNLWGGWCAEKDDKEWRSDLDTTVESDLSRARMIVAGVAGETVCRLDTPGSSLDEVALSQFISLNATAKLADPELSQDEYDAYAKQLWHEKVWSVAINILCANHELFMQLAERLDRKEKINGGKLRDMLAKIRRLGHE